MEECPGVAPGPHRAEAQPKRLGLLRFMYP
jgi:hypothetical protein